MSLKKKREYKTGVVYTPVKRGFSRRLSNMLLPPAATSLLFPEVPDDGTFNVSGWLWFPEGGVAADFRPIIERAEESVGILSEGQKKI